MLFIILLQDSVNSVGTDSLSMADAYKSILMTDFVKVFDSVLFVFLDHVFHLGVENVVMNFLCIDLASHCREKRGKKTVEICCCWCGWEGSWQGRDPRLGDALLMSFKPELLKVFIVRVESHLGCSGESVACSPCPKNEMYFSSSSCSASNSKAAALTFAMSFA